MRKISESIIVVILIIVGILTICTIVENASAQEVHYVKLYQHVETELDVDSGWLDTIRGNPESADRIKIAENAVSLDWEIIYTLTPALQSTLYLHTNTNYYIQVWLQSDSTANNVEVHVHFESEDGSQHWAHKTDTKDVTSGGTAFSLDFTMGNLENIIPDENIRLRINVVYTGLPRALYIINDNDHPSGISMPTKNPLNVEISASVDEENEKVTAQATISSPFGAYHIDTNSYVLTWTGPTTPTKVTKTGDTVWEWNYAADEAKSGDYQVSITATDIIEESNNPNSISSETGFTIPESEDDSVTSTLTSPYILGLILIIIIIIIVLVIVYKRRKDIG